MVVSVRSGSSSGSCSVGRAGVSDEDCALLYYVSSSSGSTALVYTMNVVDAITDGVSFSEADTHCD